MSLALEETTNANLGSERAEERLTRGEAKRITL
jgi:hypothetical protein